MLWVEGGPLTFVYLKPNKRRETIAILYAEETYMKTIFTLLLATVFSASAFAYNEGKISITVPSSNNLQLQIDGRNYSLSDNSFVLGNVSPGSHSIRIYRSGKRGGNRDRNRNADVLYAGNVYVKPSYHVDLVLNRFGKALVDERSLSDRNGVWFDDDDDYNHGNSNGNGGYQNGGYQNGGYGNGYTQAISDYEFNNTVKRVRDAWTNRMNIAKDEINRSYFTSMQIRQLLQLFNLDSERLDLAKLAYSKSVDRQNYRQTFDVFSFDSSKNELEQWIRNYR